MPHKKKKAIPPKKALAVSVSVVGTHDATTACVTILGGSYTKDLIQAAGSAKRRAGDRYNERVAWDLSVGRALVELGLRLQADGEARVQSDAETLHAEKLAAALRRTERRLRRDGPHPRLLPVSQILAEHGPEAAKRAAWRRGDEQALTGLVQGDIPPAGRDKDRGQPPGYRRDNGLPTIESGTTKETS